MTKNAFEISDYFKTYIAYELFDAQLKCQVEY